MQSKKKSERYLCYHCSVMSPCVMHVRLIASLLSLLSDVALRDARPSDRVSATIAQRCRPAWCKSSRRVSATIAQRCRPAWCKSVSSRLLPHKSQGLHANGWLPATFQWESINLWTRRQIRSSGPRQYEPCYGIIMGRGDRLDPLMALSWEADD